jgi:serine protease AprX
VRTIQIYNLLFFFLIGSVTTIHALGQKDLSDNNLLEQVESLGYKFLQEKLATGKGIRIAVFDGGFAGVDTHPAFAHLFENNLIVATWNFPANTKDVYRDHSHGTSVLSCITGLREGQAIGLAQGSEFLLARTELSGEPIREQRYWIQAVDWAIENKANIIISSLGYTSDHYFPEDMTGISPVAEAARKAFNHGILVINSNGNDGDGPWKISGTPADAKEVLSVGAISIDGGYKMDFSSFGPSFNDYIKPNVVAAGKVLAATPKGWKTMIGTSFSAPLIAGYAACIWELFPELSNKELFRLIERTGSLFPYFDYAHGYGIPNPETLQQPRNERFLRDLNIRLINDTIFLSLADELKQPTDLLFFHFADSTNHLLEYQVVRMNGRKNITIPIKNEDSRIFRARWGKQYAILELKNERGI